MTHPAPIRVLQFLADFNIGGTERHVLGLVASLDPSRFSPVMACLKRRGPFLEAVESARIPLVEYRVESFLSPRAAMSQLRFWSDLRREETHIVHTYGFYANLFGILPARLARRPLVVASIRDTGAHLDRLKKSLQRSSCMLADHLIVNAEAVRKWLIEEGYPARKLTVIRNGIPVRPRVLRSGAFHRESGLGPDNPLVGVVARLNAVKGVEFFLEAAAVIAARNDRVRFVVIGDGPLRPALEGRARGLGLERKVLFTGFRTDVANILPELSVSVLPSLSEGLPNTVLESMAAGVPVVCTRVGGTGEIITDGDNGLLVEPGDSAALACAIGEILDQPALGRRLGESGRARIERDFSERDAANRTEQLYLNLLAAKRARARALVGSYVD